ncbi:MAG: nucleotidyltransferase family protein [Tannerella sp.]|nr:nucleotidyltransferase family protein [Tannerella sp.]
MKAMVLAAGVGSRLKPLTDTMPKALVPVNGKPMLEHILLKLKTSGFTHVIINVHHFGKQITDFLDSRQHFGLQIDISDESGYLMDTGGGIKQAAPFLNDGEPFLVHNVDVFSNVDLKDMYECHVASKALATLLVASRQTSRYLLFNKDNCLCGWCNRETGETRSFYPGFDPSQYTEYAFSGIHIISPDIFRWMDDWTGKFSIINFYLSICPKTVIRPYTMENLRWMDAGKIESFADVQAWLKEEK